MSNKHHMSLITRRNWLMDALLFSAALFASLSGVYFLFLPVGGYQGGRNPFYGVTVIFQRETWDLMHTWSGVIMIAAALIHLIFHWDWVVSMSRRLFRRVIGQGKAMNRRSLFNVAVNAVIAVSFLLTAVSGIYFLFFSGGHQAKLLADPQILFTRTTWDLVHTWAGVTMIIAAVIHFAIHWQWVVKVTRKLFIGAIGQWMPETSERETSASV